MLAGVPPFAGLTSFHDLLEAKRFLAQRLPHLLAAGGRLQRVADDLLPRAGAPDPMRRFPSAEAADLVKEGAASFHRQLIKGDLASEYDNEIRTWLAELAELPPRSLAWTRLYRLRSGMIEARSASDVT